MGRILFADIFVCILTGGIPLFFAFHKNDIKGVENTLSALMPPEDLFWYTLSLSVLAILVDFLNRFFQKRTDLTNTISNFLDDVVSQIAPSIQTIFRTLSGAIVAFIVVWAKNDAESFEWSLAISFLCLAVVIFLEAAGIRWIQNTIANKWVRIRPRSLR